MVEKFENLKEKTNKLEPCAQILILIVWIWVYSSFEKIWQEKPLTENQAMDFEGNEENLDEWIRKLDYGTNLCHFIR